MSYASRRQIQRLRGGSFIVTPPDTEITETYDFTVSETDAFDAILLHYSLSSLSGGTVAITFYAVPDGASLLCTIPAWTTGTISSEGDGTLILAAPLPGKMKCVVYGASSPDMALFVYLEKVKVGN